MSGLRRRFQSDAPSSGGDGGGIGLNSLRSIDAYTKTIDDFRVKTRAGGLVSLISVVFMATLFVSEVNYFLSKKITDELRVDTSKGEKIQINVDITLHNLPCSYVGVDAMDSSGAQQLSVETNLYKKRVGKDGSEPQDSDDGRRPITDKAALGDNGKAVKMPEPGYCGSCYGAARVGRACCNTCAEVRKAYQERNWVITDYSTIEQCVREGFLATLKLNPDEGCNIFGYLDVNRVAGSFHIAPGQSFQQMQAHVHELDSLGGMAINTTHTINSLSFGTAYPGMTNPLDGVTKVSTEASLMYQYYIKVVPTVYTKANGQAVNTNQFSTTLNVVGVGPGTGNHGLPGIFFNYDLSPIVVNITETRRSVMHFLINVCGIVGGIFTLAGIVDSIIYRSQRRARKSELGIGK